MPIEITDSKHFAECRKEWNTLFSDFQQFSHYQSHEFLNDIKKGFLPKRPFKALLSKEYNFIINDNTGLLAIFAGLKSGQTLYLRGSFTGAGNLDFVYRKNINQNQFDEILKRIKNESKAKRVIFDRISELSITNILCTNSSITKKTDAQICVSIPLPSTYDEWFGSLGKNTRQNIRTSYNRLNKDNCSYKFEFHNQEFIDTHLASEIIRLFAKRAAEYKNISAKYLWRIMKYVKESDPVVKYILYNHKVTYSTLRIEGVLVAAMLGFENQDGSWIIPKLAINTNYSKYSPGGLLINESIKYIFQHSLPINAIDLSRGDEKYKYTYGGQQYMLNRYEY